MICRQIHKLIVFKVIFIAALIVFVFSNANQAFAQSSDQNAPTPLVTNEIRGQIKARDIGDSRLTTYYYIFNGQRGDVFINVVTNNLNGDIDIFTADTLKPRTKITVYADSSNNETGRIVYMRQPEKLLMRIQGRTPNDDPATYQIKFAGSFQAINPSEIPERPDLPELDVKGDGVVKVNSVGTIIEEPKEDDSLDETRKDNKKIDTKTDVAKSEEDKTGIPKTFDPTRKTVKTLPEDESILRPRVIITDDSKSETKAENIDKEEKADLTVNIEDKKKNTSAVVTIERVEEDEKESKEAEEARKLAKISLKVKLKNGDKFERPMNEVTSVNVIKTVLTIVTSDGKIHEFSIFDVSKMTID